MIRKLLDKLNKMSPAAKASMALLFANLVLKGISLVSTPLFTRIMSTDQYGLVTTFMSWSSLATVIVTLNLSSGVFNNGMLDFKDNRNEFQFSLLIITTISCALFFMLFLIFRKPIVTWLELPEAVVYILFLKLLFVPAYSFWGGRQRYEFKYKALTAVTIFIAVASMIAGIAAVLISPNQNDGTAKIIATESVSIIVGAFFFLDIARKAKFHAKFSYCKYALRFNLPLLPHYLSMYVLSSSDRIMISKMINTSATAVYSVSYTVASVITIIWNSIEASLSPWIYEELDKKRSENVKRVTLQVIGLFAVLCLLCTLFAPEIMTILAPSSYSEGVYVIPPVASGVFFTAMYSLYMRMELFYKQTGFAAVASTIAAVLNIVLNYIFIPIFGFVAAGYTTMACYAVLALCHYINVREKSLDYILDNRTFLTISVLVIGASCVISMIYGYVLIRYGMIAVIMVTCIIKHKQIISIFMKK